MGSTASTKGMHISLVLAKSGTQLLEHCGGILVPEEQLLEEKGQI